MSEATTTLPRRFINESMVLKDPDPNATPEDVMALYAEHYPALVNGHVTGPVLKEDAIEYTFVTRYETKGADGKDATDFSLMAEIDSILRRESFDDPAEAAPTEIVEPVC